MLQYRGGSQASREQAWAPLTPERAERVGVGLGPDILLEETFPSVRREAE